MSDRGCPYRDKHGKTCSESQAVRVLYEPNKERDMERNKIQALNNTHIKESDYVKGQAEVVSAQEFDKLSDGLKVFYRGQETSQHVLEDSSAPQGSHAWGRGLYFTTNQQNAESNYSKGRQLIRAIPKAGSRIVRVEDAYNKFKEITGKPPKNNLEASDFFAKNNLYDALYIQHGSTGHENYLLVLNRSALYVNYIRY